MSAASRWSQTAVPRAGGDGAGNVVVVVDACIVEILAGFIFVVVCGVAGEEVGEEAGDIGSIVWAVERTPPGRARRQTGRAVDVVVAEVVPSERDVVVHRVAQVDGLGSGGLHRRSARGCCR